MRALARGPIVVRFDWVVSDGESHPERTYLDRVSSEPNALQAGRSALQLAARGSIRLAAAWWRPVGPGESQAEGTEEWIRICSPGSA